MRHVLVTGGCGFIGSAFLRRYVPAQPEVHFTNLDALTYAGDPANVESVAGCPNYSFVHGDVRDRTLVNQLVKQIDGLVHFAAESHVDRSIVDSSDFVTTNICGTHVLLEAARQRPGLKFVLVSTDEVYGSLSEDDAASTEDSPLRPGSPYSAAKASADLLALSFVRTYGLDVRITRCANNYGPFQYPEKLIPVLVRKAVAGASLPIYGDGRNIRDWLYVDDHAAAVLAVLQRGQAGRIYNVGGDSARRNLEIARGVLTHLSLPESRLEYVRDRPGHDWRYCVDDQRLRRELQWKPETPFEAGMRQTIDWYLEQGEWVERALARGQAATP